MYIGATFPVKAQSNYKVKLTGIVYEYDQNNKLLPLEFAAKRARKPAPLGMGVCQFVQSTTSPMLNTYI